MSKAPDLTFLQDLPIELDGISYPNNIADHLRIDRTNLEEEFAIQSECYAYYASMEAIAKDKRARLKHGLELLYAQLDAEKRAAAQAMQVQNPKFKYTEKMAENEVKGDKRYQIMLSDHLEADRLVNLLGAWRSAMDHKRESLVSLGAHDRTGNMSTRVLAEQAKHTLREKAKPITNETTTETEETKKATRRRPARGANGE